MRAAGAFLRTLSAGRRAPAAQHSPPDQNLFKIWIYDRGAKTRPNQSIELKRIIGGLNTKIEFQCGLYIDPANGDIYAVNNDTIDTLVIFSRQAIGNVAPDRELHTPH